MTFEAVSVKEHFLASNVRALVLAYPLCLFIGWRLHLIFVVHMHDFRFSDVDAHVGILFGSFGDRGHSLCGDVEGRVEKCAVIGISECVHLTPSKVDALRWVGVMQF